MLGTSTTVVAARVWHESVTRLQRVAAGVEAETTWGEAIATASKARRRFYESAKADIGIALGQSPEAYEWQLTRLVPVDGDIVKGD